jgi:hypothetical protein
VDLSAGKNEAQRPTKCIGQHVDLLVNPPLDRPRAWFWSPLFPVAACWWARTNVVSSMRYSFLRSLVRTLNTRSQTPFLAHRAKRVDAFPFAISPRQVMPVRARAQHPQDTVDEETIVRGGAAGIAGLPGSRPSIRRHRASDSSYRLTMSHAPNHLIRNTRNHRDVLNVDWT